MNKRKVDELIPNAYKVLSDVGIAEAREKTIDRAWRGQISAFGAAVSTGSLISAVTLFSAQRGASVDRKKIVKAIWQLLNTNESQHNQNEKTNDCPDGGELLSFIKNYEGGERKAKEDFINAAIALKLAMNLYILEKGDCDAKSKLSPE